MARKMTIRERILATVRGEDSGVPLTIYMGLLPRGQDERELRELGLGLQVQMPVHVARHPHAEVEKCYTRVGEETLVRTLYRTPVGEARLVQRVRANAG